MTMIFSMKYIFLPVFLLTSTVVFLFFFFITFLPRALSANFLCNPWDSCQLIERGKECAAYLILSRSQEVQ